MQADLPFAAPEPARVAVADQVVLLRSFVLTGPLRALIEAIAAISPFRHLETPGGGRMSVAMTNAGAVGWYSDANGYRYEAIDPLTGAPWPPMPALFTDLALRAAAAGALVASRRTACW